MTTLESRAAPVAVAGGASGLTGVIGHDDSDGTITAIVAVTGVRDEVGDVIVPGAIGRSLARITPKGCIGHNWNARVSKVVTAEELMPGDPRLPQLTFSGDPWPREAGAMLVKAKYNLAKPGGRDAYEDAKFYEKDEAFSIGYRVHPNRTKKRGSTRYIGDLDIYEFSQVLHGAHPLARLTGVKSLVDTLQPPEPWYDAGGSGIDSEGYDVLDGVEFKIRYVRDSEFWGLPWGTPIRPGFAPQGPKAKAIRKAGGIPSPRYGADPTPPQRVTSEPGAATLRKQGEADEPGLFPEAGLTRRVTPRRARRGASDDPVTDLARADPTEDQEDINRYLGDVLDRGLTPNEFETQLQHDVHDLDTDGVWDDPTDLAALRETYRDMYRARAAEDAGQAAPKVRPFEAPAKGTPHVPPPKPVAATSSAPSQSRMTTADYERIKKNSHPDARDANLGKLSDADLAAIKHEAHRRGGRGQNMQDSVRTEEIRRRSSPDRLRAQADEDIARDKRFAAQIGRSDQVTPSRFARQLHERADDYEARDAAGVGRHDFEVLPHGHRPGLTPRGLTRSQYQTLSADAQRSLGAHNRDKLIGILRQLGSADPETDADYINTDDPLNWRSKTSDRLAIVMHRLHPEREGGAVAESPHARKPESAPEPVVSTSTASATEPGSPADKIHAIADRLGDTPRARYLSPFLAPDAAIRTSPDGVIAAAQGPDGRWVLTDTVSGNPLPSLPADTPSERVDDALKQIAEVGIDWSDPAAVKRTWAADPQAKRRVTRAIQDIADQAGRPEPTPGTGGAPGGTSEIRQARQDAEDSIDDHDRDALADALTRMGVGAGGDDRDPYDVAAGLLTLDRETQAKRLDRLQQAATMVADGTPAPTVRDTPSVTAATSADTTAPIVPDWGARIGGTPSYGTPDGPVWMHRKGQAVRFYDAAGQQVGPEQSNLGPAAAYALSQGWESSWMTAPGSVPSTADEVITPGEQADAENLRGDALGLVEAEDGQLEVTEEVAQRQDRVEALIETDGADLGNRTTEELGGTRRDLVDEIALQDEIRRRDAARRQEARAQRADAQDTISQPEPEASSATPPEGPKARPGLAGAIEDLADLLNEHGVKAHDHPDVQAAATRLATVLRRNKQSDSKAAQRLRTLLGDDPHAAVAAGRLKPGELYTLAGALREEARNRRNAAARTRRLARRIEREKLRSLLGKVDTELRSRGERPEDYGGALPDLQAAERQTRAPDAGDLATHQRPPDLVAQDRASQDRAARARDLIRQARQASEGGDHARAVDLVEQAQEADPSRAARMAEMRNRFVGLRDAQPPAAPAREPDAPEITKDQLRRGTLKGLGIAPGDRIAYLPDDRHERTTGGQVVIGTVDKDGRGGYVITDDSGKRHYPAGATVMYAAKLNPNGTVITPSSDRGDVAKADDLARQSRTAFDAGEHDRALELIGQAADADPGRADRWAKIRQHIEASRPAPAPKVEPPAQIGEPADDRSFGALTTVPATRLAAGGKYPTLPGDQLRVGDQVYLPSFQKSGTIRAIHPKGTWAGHPGDWLELDDNDGNILKFPVGNRRGIPVLNPPDDHNAPETRTEAVKQALALGDQADRAVAEGRHADAAALYERAHSVDPNNDKWSNAAARSRSAAESEPAVPPSASAPSTLPERGQPGSSVFLRDGRAVDVRADDGDQVRVWDGNAGRSEVVDRDQIVTAGPTPDNPTEIYIGRSELARRVAEVRFRDAGADSDPSLGATVSEDGDNLVVHDAAAAAITLDDAVETLTGRLADERMDPGTRSTVRRELTATKALRERVGALAQSPPEPQERGARDDTGPVGPAGPGPLPDVPARGAGRDTGPADVLPAAELPGAGRDRGHRGRPDGAGGGRRPGPDREGGNGQGPGRGTGPAPDAADRPGGASDQAGQRRAGTGERGDRGPAGESGAGRGESGTGGLRGGETGTGRPAEKEGVTGDAQPDANPGQVDAIPDTGPSFRPGGVDDLAPAGERAKLDANLAALRVLRRLQTPDVETHRYQMAGAMHEQRVERPRVPTPEDQAILARWAGWGGLPDVFDDTKDKYAAERTELKELLSPAEYDEARRNTLNAHYTDARVVSSIWRAVRDLGFDGGRVLEPGSGSGNFIGFAPEDLTHQVQMTGVELDSTTAAISKALYPHADIRNESFAKTRLPDGVFDATVGNVPFGNFALTDRRHNANKESIHNYFVLKSLALTKPGGLVAVLTSRYTLDSEGDRARRQMADMADLVGAVRLPTGSHQRASGTNVIEDILIFRRREPGAEPRGDQSWITARKRDLDGWEVTTSDYWDAHPDHILGTMQGVKGQYGGDIRVVGDRDMTGLPDVLDRVVADAKADGLTATGHDPGSAGVRFAAPNELHEGAITTDENGDFVQNVNGALVPMDVPDKQREELGNLVGLRTTLAQLLQAEADSKRDTPRIRELRQDLNDRYDAYVAKFGPISRYTLSRSGARVSPGQGGFRKDPGSASIRALEKYNPDTGAATKAAIFRKRAVAPRELPTSADTPEDALAVCIDTVGRIDLPTIAKLLNTNESDARHQLDGLVYETPPLSAAETDAAWQAVLTDNQGDMPELDSVAESVRGTGALVTSAEYLSGNVRRKLAAARAAAEHDPRFKTNTEALAAVIPQDLTPQEIEGRLGASWLSAGDVKDFVDDLLEIPAHDRTTTGSGYGRRPAAVSVSTSGSGIWEVTGPEYGNLAREQWGTSDRSAIDLIKALLEQRSIRVTRSVEGPDGKTRSVPDLEATLAAQEKAAAIADRFSEWLWEDPDRSRRLQARYNNLLNAIRLRTYDGVHLTLPGKSHNIEPYAHQHAAVARIVNEPAALLGHVVGGGKTYEMAMGAMELKRLGLARKPVIVVPNHMKEQFQTEFLQLYPQAKLLAAGTEDLAGPKRREFVARAAVGDWDCVILTQKAFEAIPMSPAAQKDYITRELADLRRQLEEAKARAAGSGDKAAQNTVKRMEKTILRAEEKMKEKLEKGLKDIGGVTFEQTGIDYLFIDEAHHYSNLRTLSNIQGAGADGSSMATDLHMKIEHLREHNASDRVVTFATGTPVRNTVTQAYIMMRYLRPDLLKDAGINSFDQWAATFGEVVEEMELKPEGNGFRQTSRFAKFRNVPELLQIFHIIADIKLAEDLNLPTPELRGGKPENVVIPRTAQQAEFIADLGRRAELVRAGSPLKFTRVMDDGSVREIEDNMLLVSMDGRKAALNMQLVGGTHEAGKIDAAADRIHRIWDEHKDRRYPIDPKNPDMGDDPVPGALQIVFLDMGTPSDKGAKAGEWNAYDELKSQLVARGMDASKIRYMHEAKNDRQKAEMFAAARSGQISVLIGSTEKMGVGTNVQARAIALHHLDAPWRPSDLEQREGRIMRQGNMHKELGIPIEIHRYVTEGSFDAYMWQTLERKSKFINQLLRGTLDVREIEDVGDNSLSYAEVKALATGNPDLMEVAKVDTLLGKLTRLKRTHDRTQANLERDMQLYAVRVGDAESAATALDTAIPRRTRTYSGDNFTATAGSATYTKVSEANAALNQQLRDVLNGWSTQPTTVGEIGGFSIVAQQVRAKSGGMQLSLSLNGIPGLVTSYGYQDLQGTPSTITRLVNALSALEIRRDRERATAQHLRGEIDRMRERVGLPFGRADELAAAEAKSSRLREKMLRDARRVEGADIPFDPMIDSDRYDSPLVGGGSAADGRPEPDDTLEREHWEAAQRLRREQHQREAAKPRPSGVDTALAAVDAGIADDLVDYWRTRNLQTIADAPRDAVYASSDGRVVATQEENGDWLAVDARTGLRLSPASSRWDPIQWRTDVQDVLDELANLSVPWGDPGLTKAKLEAKRGSGSDWRWKLEKRVGEIWERGTGAAEEKSIESKITPGDLLRLARLEAEIHRSVMPGFG